ncbi:MAG: hypothetical protein P1V20_23980 [Verrucomicrobiales bacterium]|nr:hypothetical protein [Verrucomicrobiales bacterium]
MRKLPQRLACLFAVLSLSISSLDVVHAQSSEPSEAPKWTDTDSRLANHYLRLIQQKPEFGNVLDLLWDLYEKKNQTPLLMDYIGKAAEPEQAYIPKLIYAHLLRKADRTTEARSFYDDVAKGLPENIPALKALAEISEQQNRVSKALSYYTRLVKLIPAEEDDGVAIRFRKASLHQARGQTRPAVAIWNQILKARPHDPKIRSEVVSLLLEVGETSGALDVLEQQAADSDVKIRLAALEELTRVYELINDFEGASRAAEKAMQVLHFKNHQHRSFFEKWVKLHERFDRLDELETRLNNNVEDENPSESSLYRLTEFYHLIAEYKKEEEVLETLVERIPNSVDYRVRLAEMQLANDRFETAAETMDEILQELDSVPWHLLLVRVKIDLNAEEELAAEKRLEDYLKNHPGDPDVREKIVEFARTNYLDGLVEKLLRQSVDGGITGSDGDSAPLDLARFLHERGRYTQAREVIEKYIDGSGGSATERTRRLHYAALAYRDLDMGPESEGAVDEALESQPDNIEFLTTKAGLLVDRGDADGAIQLFEKIRELHQDTESKTEIDQRIFSLLRANISSPIPAPEEVPVPSGPIRSVSQFRKLAEQLSTARRDVDNETPQVLHDYFAEIKSQANRLSTVEARYRAAWWALKMQDNHEVYFQLLAAKKDAERDKLPPPVEVEEMLLELAIQNERPENIVRHLDTLCKIDPANYEEYRHRWAEAKFNLGAEDTAVRELRKLASSPEASLDTLRTLAKVYAAQGSTKKEISVWENAYRKANLFEKRRIVRLLVAALLEQKKPQEALKAQMDLVYRETDQLQRRKQFESQVTVASRNYLLDWLKDRYLEAAQKHPFDKFFPEALGRIHLAMGHHREAFDAMKKAYYMSGENDELLDELGDLAGKLGDLKSASDYSRQMIARGEGAANIDNWENLIRMLEKDFRSGEADLMRSRLEVKFGQDPDFLERLAGFYLKNDRLEDAHRVYRKRAKLRDWDVRALFDLALIKMEFGDRAAARPILESILEKTANEPLPTWAQGNLWPVIDASADPATAFEMLNSEVQTFPMIPTEVEDEFFEWSNEKRPFTLRPRDTYAVRLRAYEEFGKCIRDLPDKDRLVFERLWQPLPDHEKMWLAFHSRSAAALESLIPIESTSSLENFAIAKGIILAGDFALVSTWEDNLLSGGLSLPAAAAFSSYLAVKEASADHPELVVEYLADRNLHESIVNYIFTEWKNYRRFSEAVQFGEANMADDPNLAFLVAQVIDWIGDTRKQADILDTALEKMTALEYGGHLPHLTQIAMTERFRIADSSEERISLLEKFRGKFYDNPLRSKLTESQLDVLTGYLSADYENAFASLSGVTTGLLDLKPQQSFFRPPALTADNFGWERLKREMRFYTELFPRKARQSDAFASAFGGQPFAYSESVETFRIYEHLEGFRFAHWLNGKSTVDRANFLDRVLPEFRSLDGRLDFARELETFGYHREAAQIYHREVVAGTQDYAPIRGLFKNAARAHYPEPGLDILAKLKTGEVDYPPGLTDEYLNEQHARLLRLSGNIELLTQLAQPPATGDGEPPVKTTSHLPYQDELIIAYREAGEKESLLRLLTHQRKRNESSGRDLLLGAELLIEQGAWTEALAWLDQITYSQIDRTTELAALGKYLEIFRSKSGTTKQELEWLSRVSLPYRSLELTRNLADFFIQRGEIEEALSLLRIYHRNERNDVFRSHIQFVILNIYSQLLPGETEALSRELGIYLTGLGEGVKNLSETALPLAEWTVKNRDLLTGHIPLLESYSNHPRAGLLTRLLLASLRESLAEEFALLRETSTTNQLEIALLILSRLGEQGKALAEAEVQSSRRPGPTFFEGRPDIQIRFFSDIDDRTRLLETHASLMRMADSWFFSGRSGLPAYPTLQRHWQIPELLNNLGHKNLAGSLYRSSYESIRQYREGEMPFLENYVNYLIAEQHIDEAERVLQDIANYSLGFDRDKLASLPGE